MMSPVPPLPIEATRPKSGGKAEGTGATPQTHFASDLATSLAGLGGTVPPSSTSASPPIASMTAPLAPIVPPPMIGDIGQHLPEMKTLSFLTSGFNQANGQGVSHRTANTNAIGLKSGPDAGTIAGTIAGTTVGTNASAQAQAAPSSSINPGLVAVTITPTTASTKKADKKPNEAESVSKNDDLSQSPPTAMPPAVPPSAVIPSAVMPSTVMPSTGMPSAAISTKALAPIAQNMVPLAAAQVASSGSDENATIAALAAPSPSPMPSTLPEPSHLTTLPPRPHPPSQKTSGSKANSNNGVSLFSAAPGVEADGEQGDASTTVQSFAATSGALAPNAISSNAMTVAHQQPSMHQSATEASADSVSFPSKGEAMAFEAMPPFAVEGQIQKGVPVTAAGLAGAAPVPNSNPHSLTLSTGPVPYGMLPIEIGLGALQGQRALEVRLSPEDLGTVEIRLEVSDDSKVKAKISADRPETLAMMMGDASLLRNALDQSGLTTSADSLQFSLRQDNNAATGNGNGNSAQQQPQGQSNPQGRNGSPQTPFQETIPLTTLRRAAGLLDVNI